VALTDAHAVMAWVLIVSNAAVGAWAVSAHWVAVLRRPALWWSIGVAWVLVVAQVLLGVGVQVIDGITPPPLHALYGYSALVAVGLVYSYAKQMTDRRYLLYGLGSLFIMGLGIRELFLNG
jgi:hypothetical protein